MCYSGKVKSRWLTRMSDSALRQLDECCLPAVRELRCYRSWQTIHSKVYPAEMSFSSWISFGPWQRQDWECRLSYPIKQTLKHNLYYRNRKINYQPCPSRMPSIVSLSAVHLHQHHHHHQSSAVAGAWRWLHRPSVWHALPLARSKIGLSLLLHLQQGLEEWGGECCFPNGSRDPHAVECSDKEELGAVKKCIENTSWKSWRG